MTGAAGGIGAAVVDRLALDDIGIFAVDLEPAATSYRGPGTAFAADLGTREGNIDAVAAALDRFGRLDIVVANAGFQHVAPIAEFPEEQWDALLAVMLTSPFLLAKHAWPALVAAPGGGRFVAIASAHALVASPFKAGYVAAKHGVLGLVKTLAIEGAENGVSGCAICPGYVRTALVEGQNSAQALAHEMTEIDVLHDVILAAQPVRRLIEPAEVAEVAEVAAFLIGPHGRSFTGVPVSMDQGWTAR